MTLFRPCIDLHDGQVKQIVGGTLRDQGEGPRENFVSALPAEHYAELYRRDGLTGGHVIQLGSGNEEAATRALAAYPKGLQLGGGVTPKNARFWLDQGASQVIVTSYLFSEGRFSLERLREMRAVVSPEELVIDLSCRRGPRGYHVATNRWQTVTETVVDAELLRELAPHSTEFLIHAADVEGLCQGIEEELVIYLGEHSPIPCVYAGGARSTADLVRVRELSGGKVDLTIGSALDIFGGSGARYGDCVEFNRTGVLP